MDNIDKSIIKDDINFLEYPNWVVVEKEALKEFVIEKDNGAYKIATSVDSLPNRFDKIVLYYLLYELFDTTKPTLSQITTTRYKLVKNIFYRTNSVGRTHYERIMLSLKRWSAIFIEFEGVFYDGDNYTKRYFHVIDDVILDDKKRQLYIKFNDQYIKQLKESNFYKLINFEEYKKLTKPISARLYEILVKTFKSRWIWQTGIIKLAEKLTLEKRKNSKNYYPSDVLIKVRPAINEINIKTELEIKLEYDKKTQICKFTKIKKVKQKEETRELELPKDDKFKQLITFLPQKHQSKKTILDAIASAYHKQGYNYVARNIKYTNQCSNGNYRAYLAKALKEDWGVSIQEDEEGEKRIIKERECKAIEKANCQQQEKELTKQVKEYIGNLSPDEVEDLKIQALKRLESSMQEKVKAGNYYAKTALKIEMETLVSESLK